jgi:glycosyltransferase involved in cell wall biosynthesis
MHTVMSIRQAGNFDLIHCHNGPPSELGMALSHLVDTPMLTTLHNNLVKETEFIWGNYRGWYNTISSAQYRALPELPQASFAGVVHNGIDVDTFPYQEEKSDYALYIGRFAPVKGAHLAIAAARKAGMRLLLAGKIEIPEERDYFESFVRPHIDGNHVEFIGEADSETKRQLYKWARCVLSPIQWEEPFGLVMVEAMACGTPPISFARGAAPELIADGVTGFLVDDVDEMASAIERVDSVEPLTCRQHVENCFGPAALADRYIAMYQRILAARAGREMRYE